MKKIKQPPPTHQLNNNTANPNLQLSVFDDQDGKMVDGTVTGITATHFSLQCTDGQLRKFDIGQFEGAWLSARKAPDRVFKSVGVDLY